MIQRIFYALKMGWIHRHALKKYIDESPTQSVKTIIELDPALLKEAGISALILDFDGVLGPYAAEKTTPAVIPWLLNCSKIYPKGSLFVLTNRPSSKRYQFLEAEFPDLKIVKATAKKPYPDGILQVLSELKDDHIITDPQSVLMIDDRLLTGILAAIIAGTKACYVTMPFASYSKKPLAEFFFWCLRKLERGLIRVIG